LIETYKGAPTRFGAGLRNHLAALAARDSFSLAPPRLNAPQR
jgi:hypothetical protein